MVLEIVFIVSMLFLAFFTLANIPGPLLISMAAWLYGWQTNFENFTSQHVLYFVLIGILSLSIDNIFALFGAKKMGASKHGALGALIGTFAIFFMGPLGLIVGPFVGALIGETVFGKKSSDSAVKASFGAVLGVFTGIIAKMLIAFALIIWFAFIVF